LRFFIGNQILGKGIDFILNFAAIIKIERK